MNQIHEAGSAFVFDIEIRRESTLQRAQVEAEYVKLRRTPEHPRLPYLETHLDLHRKPHVEHIEFTVIDRNHFLMIEGREESEFLLMVGATGQDRWTQAQAGDQGQLTMIRSGQPFPSPFNMEQAASLARRRLTIALGGIPWVGDMPDLVDRRVGHDAWTLRFRGNDGEILSVSGRRMTDGELVLESSETTQGSSGRIIWSARFSQWTLHDGLPFLVPSLVTHVDNSDVREQLRLRATRKIGRTEASRVIQPAVADGSPIRVLDFRTPNSTSWETYRSLPTMTWSSQDGVDVIDFDAVARSWYANPSSKKSAHDSRLKWAARALGAFVVVGAVFILWMRSRR